MSQTVVAAASVAGAFLLMLCALALAFPRVAKPATLTAVTVTRVNGQNVTTEVGKVLAWSLSGSGMTLEYEPDAIFSADFDAKP